MYVQRIIQHPHNLRKPQLHWTADDFSLFRDSSSGLRIDSIK